MTPPNGFSFFWKALIVVTFAGFLFLGWRHYKTSKWLNDELWEGWIMKYKFDVDTGGPGDPLKPPPPPKPF